MAEAPDIGELRKVDLGCSPRRSPRHRPEPFIATRISLAWVTAAIRAGASDVAWAVLYHRGLARGDPFKASAQDLALDCISVDTARRQLAALEGAYLVHIDRQPGCKPTITVLDPPSPQEPAP